MKVLTARCVGFVHSSSRLICGMAFFFCFFLGRGYEFRSWHSCSLVVVTIVAHDTILIDQAAVVVNG